MSGGAKGADERHVLAEIRDGVGVITLNRPAKMNAMTVAMYADFNAATHRFERDDNVGAVMIISSGPAFCAGGDIDMIREAKAGTVDTDAIDLHMLDPDHLSKPVLCGIAGPCIGEGFAMALASDMVIAGASARFMLPEVAIGVLPVDIPLWAAARLSPIHILDALLTGDWKDAAWAERAGLVNYVLPDAEVHDATFDLARKIARAPRAVAARVKALVYEAHYTTDRPAFRRRGAAARASLLAEAEHSQTGKVQP